MSTDPRAVLTANARMQLADFVAGLLQRYDLTYGELTLVLTDSLTTWAKNQVRNERSPEAPRWPEQEPENPHRAREPQLPEVDAFKWAKDLQELRHQIGARRQQFSREHVEASELDQPFLAGVLARQWGFPKPLHPTAARGWTQQDEAQRIDL